MVSETLQSRDIWHSSRAPVQNNKGLRRLEKICCFPHSAALATVIDSGVLLSWDQIKFAGRFFVEHRAFFLISTAPVLVSSGDP